MAAETEQSGTTVVGAMAVVFLLVCGGLVAYVQSVALAVLTVGIPIGIALFLTWSGRSLLSDVEE